MGANTVLTWTTLEAKRNRANFLPDTPIRLRQVSLSYKIDVVADYLVRAVYLTLGVLLTIVGLAAILLPLVPSTTTLLASSYFLTRSWPRLQLRVNQLPLIGSLLKYLDGTRVMSPITRIGFTAYLWVNLIVTLACLHGIGLASYPIVSINIFCCALSTVFLFKSRAEPANVSQVKEAVGVAPTPPTALATLTLNQPQPLTDVHATTTSDSRPKLPQLGIPSVGLPHSATTTEHPTC